jgi:hypothetical protein
VNTLVWLDAGEVKAVGTTDEVLPEYIRLAALDALAGPGARPRSRRL